MHPRTFLLLICLILQACVPTTARQLHIDALTLAKQDVDQPPSFAAVARRIDAYRALMARQRRFSNAAYCRQLFSQEEMIEARCEGHEEKWKNPEVWIHMADIRAADSMISSQQRGEALTKTSGDFLLFIQNGQLHSMRTMREGSAVLEHIQCLQLSDANDLTDVLWYDALVVLNHQVLVFGYNEEEGVAEIHSFELDTVGRLRLNAKYWLRDGARFRPNSFAFQVFGSQLVARISSDIEARSKKFDFPEWSRRDTPNPEWHLLLDSPKISMVPGALDEWMGVHMILYCDLASLALGQFECNGSGLIGPLAVASHVASNALYLAFAHKRPEAFGNPEFEPTTGETHWAMTPPKAAQTTLARVSLGESVDLAKATAEFVRITGKVFDALNLSERGGTLYALASHWDRDGGEAMLYRIDNTLWRKTNPLLPLPLATIPKQNILDQNLFTEHAVWLVDRLHNLETDNETVTLYRQPLDGGRSQSKLMTSSVAWFDAWEDQVLVVGDSKNGVTATLLKQDNSMSTLDSLSWPKLASADSRVFSLSSGLETPNHWLLGWPFAPMDASNDRLGPALGLAIIEVTANHLRQAGVLNMVASPDTASTLSSVDSAMPNSKSGLLRFFVLGTRAFAFSGSFVKEAAYENAQLRVIRHVELPQARKDFRNAN